MRGMCKGFFWVFWVFWLFCFFWCVGWVVVFLFLLWLVLGLLGNLALSITLESGEGGRTSISIAAGMGLCPKPHRGGCVPNPLRIPKGSGVIPCAPRSNSARPQKGTVGLRL